MFKKIRVKLLERQIKGMLKQLNNLEKDLDKLHEKHPEELPEEDYKELKDIISKARDYGEKMVKKKDVNFDEFVKFANKFAEAAEQIGKKYNVDMGDKLATLKNARVDPTATEFNVDELDEEELRKLAKELKKKTK